MLHTAWNLLVKRAREKLVFSWWGMAAGFLCFAPFLALVELVSPAVWSYALASGAAESLYFILLARAYEHGDFSLVYPIARGTAPALLAVWAVLFLGERPTLPGLLGLSVLLGGLLLIGGSNLWARRSMRGVSSGGIALAFGVASCISIYSAIDAAAMRIASPLPYTVLIIGLGAALSAPVVFLWYGRHTVAAEWRANWPRIIAVGLMTNAAYILVLRAYEMTRVSYVGAVREISVVFAAIVGWRWLDEELGRLRTTGALLIFLGILVIAIAG